MTAAKPNHLAARRLLLEHLDLHPGRNVGDDLDPLELGVVGDTQHQAGGDSYHLGRDKIRARAGRDRYSVDESARDQRGLDDYASAMDIGYFKIRTTRGTFDLYDFNAWLLTLCRANDPDTADLREVIYSPDGRTVRRWDRLGRRTSGDNSHLTHTHLSEHRDANGHRMIRLASRWLQHIGLLEGDDDMTKDEFTTWMTEWSKSAAGKDALARAVLGTDGLIPGPPDSKNADGTPNTHWTLSSYVQWMYRHASDGRAYADTAVKVASEVRAQLANGQSTVSEDMLTRALVAALRQLAAPNA